MQTNTAQQYQICMAHSSIYLEKQAYEKLDSAPYHKVSQVRGWENCHHHYISVTNKFLHLNHTHGEGQPLGHSLSILVSSTCVIFTPYTNMLYSYSKLS